MPDILIIKNNGEGSVMSISNGLAEGYICIVFRLGFDRVDLAPVYIEWWPQDNIQGTDNIGLKLLLKWL